MLQFEYPWALLLFLVVALLFWRSTIFRALRFSSHRAGKRVARGRVILANIPNVCVVTSLFLAALFVANPLGDIEQEAMLSQSYRAAVLIDKSGSMSSDDKMPMARAATINFFKQRDHDLAAVIPFDDTVLFASGTPFTTDRVFLIDTVSQIEANGGSTAIGTAMLGGMWTILRDVYVMKRMKDLGVPLPSFQELRDVIAKKDDEVERNKLVARLAGDFGDLSGSFIVVATDGDNNSGIPPVDAIEFISGLRIPIYVIGIGTDMLAVPPFVSKLRETGGEFFHAKNPKDIALMYDRVSALRPTTLRTGTIIVQHSYRNEVALLIISLLFVGAVLRASFLVIE